MQLLKMHYVTGHTFLFVETPVIIHIKRNRSLEKQVSIYSEKNLDKIYLTAILNLHVECKIEICLVC